MAYSQVRSSDKSDKGVVELIADTEADINILPTYYTPGSTCIVVESSNVYMLNNQKVWKML